MAAPGQDAASRTAALKASKTAKDQEWFQGRHWRVCAEISGRRELGGHRIDYHQGFFQVTGPAVFQTPFGHKGRSGYLIQETDAAGTDLPGTVPQAFGRGALRGAIERFGAVSGLPKRDPRRSGAEWAP
jgi:hypothetical protein